MVRPSIRYGIAAMVLSALGLLVMTAQEPQEQGAPAPAAGYFGYTGGPVRGKMARTQTAATNLAESATWVPLAGATLPVNVPAGTTDLANVSFSAECRLFNGGADDYVRIRVVDIVGGVATPLEPYDAGQAFCSADAYATHTGTWAKRLSAGAHTLQVQLWIFDGAPAEVLTAWIDDWTFEAVIYD